MNPILLKIFQTVWDLNNQTAVDWFFDFSGHVDTITVYYRPQTEPCSCGHAPETELVYLACVQPDDDQEALENLLIELKTYF